jgi:hypothetical protein
MNDPKRHPAGTSVGGKFAPGHKGDAETSLMPPAKRMEDFRGADVFDEHLVEVGRRHGVAVLTANNEAAAGRPACRCCIFAPEGAENVLVIAGGVGDETTESWMVAHGYAQWEGDSTRIAAALTDAGLEFDMPENESKAFLIYIPERARSEAQRHIDDHCCPSCGAFTGSPDECDSCDPGCERCGEHTGYTYGGLCDRCEADELDDEDD